MTLKEEIKFEKERIEAAVAPKIRAIARKHGLNDEGVIEGVINFVVVAVLIVFIPGILYVVSSGAFVIPDLGVTGAGTGVRANGTYYLAQSNLSTNIANGAQTIGVIPTVLAIVLIISVLMLLAVRR